MRRKLLVAILIMVCAAAPDAATANHAPLRAHPASSPPSRGAGFAATPDGGGYWLAHDEGGVAAFGKGRQVALHVPHLARLAVAIAATPTGDGFWMAAADGGVFTFGDASFSGSAADLPLRAPIGDIVATRSGRGYWLLGEDGGVFTYGDARYFGAREELCDGCSRPPGAGAVRHPAVGMAATPDDDGYWIAYGNGAVNAFGAASSHGSSIVSPAPVDIAAATPGGYWLVDANGAVTAFGAASFHGDTRGLELNAGVETITPTATGNGYWLSASDGGVFTFGDAVFHGSDVQPAPPGAMASAGHGELRMDHGSSCWTAGDAGICADAVAPEPDTPTLITTRAANIEIRFLTSHTPTHVSARVYENNIESARTIAIAAANPTRFTAPETRGRYYVILSTFWDHVDHGQKVGGDASYYLRLDVR